METCANCGKRILDGESFVKFGNQTQHEFCPHWVRKPGGSEINEFRKAHGAKLAGPPGRAPGWRKPGGSREALAYRAYWRAKKQAQRRKAKP